MVSHGGSVVKVGLWGGEGGSLIDVGSASQIKRISVSPGDAVLSGIRIFFIDTEETEPKAFDIGHVVGSLKIINLADEEYLNSMSGHVIQYHGLTIVSQLSFTTSEGNAYGPYGGSRGTPFSLPVANGRIANLFGRVGDHVDAIGAYVATN